MTVIRSATPSDASSICAIFNPIIEETTITFSSTLVTENDVVEGIANLGDRGDPYLVAENDTGAVEGYAKYAPFRAGTGYARTAEITVHVTSTARGKGLGRALVSALEDHAHAANIHSLIAGISAENLQALEFHKKLGFERVGLVPKAGHKFGRFIDLVLMQKFV